MLSILQHSIRPSPAGRCSSRLGLLLRLQHSNGGPHKEYFQDPSRLPSRGNILRAKAPYSPPQKTYFVPEPPPSTPSSRQRQSLVSRTLRSTAWLAVSALAGVATGGAILAWAYLNTPYEPGTEDDTNLLEICDDEFNEHPMIQAVRVSPSWKEAIVVKDDFSQKNFVHGCLRGSRGLQFRAFYSPDSKVALIFVMFGSGMEGWPDIVHGGGLCTLLEDTTRFLVGHLYPDKFPIVSDMQTEFKKVTEPNVIYTLWLGPSSLLLDLETDEAILKPPSQNAHPLHDSVKVFGTLVPAHTDEVPEDVQRRDLHDPFLKSSITVIFPKIPTEPSSDEEGEPGEDT